MRISDWSSDVCSSDLGAVGAAKLFADRAVAEQARYPRQRLQVIGAGCLRCQQHEDQVNRMIVDGIEVDRRLQSGDAAIEAIQLRSLAVRDADAVPDAGGSQAPTLHQPF